MAETTDILTGPEEIEGGALVRVHGDIDYSRAPELRVSLMQVIAKKYPTLTIDLSGVPYMDSSGVATLVEALSRQKNEAKGKLVLCGMQNKVRGIFDIAKLDKVFTITDAVG